jgi:hypothetical protein
MPSEIGDRMIVGHPKPIVMNNVGRPEIFKSIDELSLQRTTIHIGRGLRTIRRPKANIMSRA